MKPSILQASPGWISPEGDFYHCAFCEHYETALKIVQSMFPTNTDRVTNYEDDLLRSQGWITIEGYGDVWYRKGRITQAQINVLSEVAMISDGYFGRALNKTLGDILATE